MKTFIHRSYPNIVIPVRETWKTIPGYVGIYEASTWGRIRSLGRMVFGGRAWYHKPGQMKKPTVDTSCNRILIGLVDKDGNGKLYTLAHVILLTFIGIRPDGMEACHWDGNTHNNRLENLRWDTHKNNEADKIRHGTNNSCGRNGSAKITKQNARRIRELYMTGRFSYSALSEMFGLNRRNNFSYDQR